MHAQTTLQHSGERWVKVKILNRTETLASCSLLIKKGKKDMKTRAHVFVSGRVQGVFFRSETKRKAAACGVNGWFAFCQIPVLKQFSKARKKRLRRLWNSANVDLQVQWLRMLI